MFRLTRPLLQAIRSSTGITGLAVHHDPIPALTSAYTKTLELLKTLPESSVYRQATEALTQHKLDVVNGAIGDAAKAEKDLDEGLIEQAIAQAERELSLAAKMQEWKAWEPLEEKPEPGQWQYFEVKETTEA